MCVEAIKVSLKFVTIIKRVSFFTVFYFAQYCKKIELLFLQ